MTGGSLSVSNNESEDENWWLCVAAVFALTWTSGMRNSAQVYPRTWCAVEAIAIHRQTNLDRHFRTCDW